MTSASSAGLHLWPRPTTSTCAFSVIDRDGAEVALRLPDAGELLCESCVQGLLNGHAPDPAQCCDRQWRQQVWMVRDPSCAVAGQGMLAHLEAGQSACRCGIVELFDVLETLDQNQRQAAVDAHVRLIRGTYAHLLAAESCNDGQNIDIHLASACARCVGEANHVDDLDASLSYATSQLALVLQAFEANLCVGPRRALVGAVGA